MGEAVAVVSTLSSDATIAAARAIAREFARDDRVVVLTSIGSSAPLYWHVPAGRQLEAARPDYVLLLVPKPFAPSSRLLLAMSRRIIMITGDEALADESGKLEKLLSESGGRLDVYAVGNEAAHRGTAAPAGVANWHRLAAHDIHTSGDWEEETMGVDTKSAPMSETELRAKEWEENFRRAEKLLKEAAEALRMHVEKTALAPDKFEREAPRQNV